ncbi:alpha/beta hydrolase [Spiroplasma sp. BIUS-1]|uniref:alpha/beta hydrolase n=1 Tax=Spiroplasma sp. BIUS-1 TaxID=216964 RepID=UPI0013987442|nr:alpha/beta fold hydrolase [Spiroplasma sp. BIUS-1]QHX36751.1 alpha/beta fold hydrolase [Spiroplasma sp. BIUS-1]
MNYKKSLRKLKRYHYNWFNLTLLIILFPIAFLLSAFCAIVFVPYLFKYPRKGKYRGLDFNTYEHLMHDLESKDMTNFNLTKDQIKEFYIGPIQEQISALMVKNKNSKKWVIGLHGFKRNKYMGLRQIYHFYDQGYNLIAFDAFAHGLTYGKYSDFGLTNAKVLDEVIKWVKATYDVEEIGVLGTSMGATSSLFFAKKYYKENKVDWLIADCPFSQAVPQIRFFLQKYMVLPWWMMSLGINWNFRRYARASIKEVNLLKGYESMNDLKVLFIHGKKDDFIMYDNSVVMYHLKHNSENEKLSQINLYDNARHSSCMHKNMEDYMNTTIAFAKR